MGSLGDLIRILAVLAFFGVLGIFFLAGYVMWRIFG